MASYNLINRAITNISAGMPYNDIRTNLLSSGESEYDCWLAFCAAEIAIDQNLAMKEGYTLEEYYLSEKIKDEEAAIIWEHEMTRDDRP